MKTSLLFLQIKTPLPAARPSAFTTTGKIQFFKNRLTSAFLLHILNLAVGILFSKQIFLTNDFEPQVLPIYLVQKL